MTRIARPRPAGLMALVFVTLTGAGARGDEGRWVGTWATSPQLTEAANMPPEPGLADSSLRQVVHVSLGGERLRVRFSNAFRTKSRTILSAHVAGSAGGGDIEPEGGKPLTFGGRTSVTIPTDIAMDPLSDLAVTIRVKDPTKAIPGSPRASRPRSTAATTCTRAPKGTRSWPRQSTRSYLENDRPRPDHFGSFDVPAIMRAITGLYFPRFAERGLRHRR